MNIAENKRWKVGELAKMTGITVRTLHHYDELDLLSPSSYSAAGHRLYTEADISKLQQIMSLKQLGFSLDEVKEFIDNPNYHAEAAIRMHLERLNKQIQIQQDLRRRLKDLLDTMSSRQDATAEQLLKIIEVMKLTEHYFTAEQLETLKKRAELLGQENIKAVEHEWPVLISKVQAALDKGTPPDQPEVIELAKRWKELVEMFTGGDHGIQASVEHLYQENPNQAAQYGINRELFQYISTAISHIG